MFARSRTTSWKLLAMAALLQLAVACSDKDATGPSSDGLVATWQATSFQVEGFDVIQQGMGVKITLTAGKTYTLVITNDFTGACEDSPNCTDTGAYSSTSTQITLDPGTPDEVTFNYAIQGSTMTLTGDIDGIPVTMKLQRS